MKPLEELQEQYYEEFKGLPSNSAIVRNGHKNDAFELVVLKVLYGKELPEFTKSNAPVFAEYVIAPPDNGIDIFFQHESGDDYTFDVIQVKHQDLTESELKSCINDMERTIDDFCKNPRSINSESCREILSGSNLDKSNKNKCTYYVVHTGTTDDFAGANENEKILTLKSLEILSNNTTDYVDSDVVKINTNMKYGEPYEGNGAIVCSINGYDLAMLCKTYFLTEIGRNILFGSNLRESLITKKSKPYKSMSKTIIDTPENFWFYNNGITIIAKDIIEKEHNTVELKEFSIVNGAQTTSALGLFLKEATNNRDDVLIEKLKKVFVLSRILKVPDEKMRQDIAIYNNTQNPITSRDMVANRDEQKHLHNWLIDDEYPRIFVEIRRGSQLPSDINKAITHRKTTNEELAQLIYASFLQRPFTAKDKKSALFNNDYTQSDYVINKIYHEIYNWDPDDATKNGVVFKLSKNQIDEVLFVQQLYKETKKLSKNRLRDRLAKAQEAKEQAATPEQIKSCDDRITGITMSLDTVGICMFYFITLYYEFKSQFEDAALKEKGYNYDKYYSDKKYRNGLIEDAANLFLHYTVQTLTKTAVDNNKAANVNNWVRSAGCEKAFLDALRNEINSNFQIEDSFKEFCDKYRV